MAAQEARGVPMQKRGVLEPEKCGPTASQGSSNAKSAENSARSRHSSRLDSVGRTVVNVIEKSSPEEVYNLSVDHLPEYYANGILVHNCEWVPGVNDKSPDRMDALVWAVTELVVDPELQELTMIRERDWYTISPI